MAAGGQLAGSVADESEEQSITRKQMKMRKCLEQAFELVTVWFLARCLILADRLGTTLGAGLRRAVSAIAPLLHKTLRPHGSLRNRCASVVAGFAALAAVTQTVTAAIATCFTAIAVAVTMPRKPPSTRRPGTSRGAGTIANRVRSWQGGEGRYRLNTMWRLAASSVQPSHRALDKLVIRSPAATTKSLPVVLTRGDSMIASVCLGRSSAGSCATKASSALSAPPHVTCQAMRPPRTRNPLTKTRRISRTFSTAGCQKTCQAMRRKRRHLGESPD